MFRVSTLDLQGLYSYLHPHEADVRYADLQFRQKCVSLYKPTLSRCDRKYGVRFSLEKIILSGLQLLLGFCVVSILEYVSLKKISGILL